jgi:hypothetical protein
VSLRELKDNYLPSALDLYISIDMGTWVVGEDDVDGQVAHPACDYTHWRGMKASMLHQRYTVLQQMHSHMLCHVQSNTRVERYSRCTKVMNPKHAVTYANPWTYRRMAQDDSLTLQPHNKHANDSDDDIEKAC